MQRSMFETMLESVLDGFQLRVEVIDDPRYCGTFYEDEPRAQRGQFHLIGEGACTVRSASAHDGLALYAGDLVMFPHGLKHSLTSMPGAEDPLSPCYYTSMLCGELDFALGTRNPVLSALPDCLVVRGSDSDDAFRALGGLLMSASRSVRLGRQVVMNKLADSLFALAVCEWAQRASDAHGIFAALSDPRIARVLEAIHTRPGEDWTLERLAGLACMSRSAFALHFSEVMSVPPMHYLGTWRAAQANRLLRDRRLSVAAIAEQLGYQSEAAFRKLFKRVYGVGPGQVRASADGGDG